MHRNVVHITKMYSLLKITLGILLLQLIKCQQLDERMESELTTQLQSLFFCIQIYDACEAYCEIKFIIVKNHIKIHKKHTKEWKKFKGRMYIYYNMLSIVINRLHIRIISRINSTIIIVHKNGMIIMQLASCNQVALYLKVQ